MTELRQNASSFAIRNGFSDFQFPSREAVNHAVDALRGQHCEIESIVPTTSTLEEIFVKAVGP